MTNKEKDTLVIIGALLSWAVVLGCIIAAILVWWWPGLIVAFFAIFFAVLLPTYHSDYYEFMAGAKRRLGKAFRRQ